MQGLSGTGIRWTFRVAQGTMPDITKETELSFGTTVAWNFSGTLD